jgi:hypothetical protein
MPVKRSGQTLESAPNQACHSWLGSEPSFHVSPVGWGTRPPGPFQTIWSKQKFRDSPSRSVPNNLKQTKIQVQRLQVRSNQTEANKKFFYDLRILLPIPIQLLEIKNPNSPKIDSPYSVQCSVLVSKQNTL